MHLPALIVDLVVILIAAGLTTLLFKWLKQPLVLGYLLAGVLAGPAVKVLPTVREVSSIDTWGEIGVIFLLFNLGLDFSVKKLMKVGGTATVGAATVLIGMMFVGYMVGSALGLDRMNCIFLGAMLSMSSTTIIFKAFDEMGLRNRQFTGVVFGILIVEDIFAVLMLVLLSTLAVSRSFEGEELLMNIGRLVLFLVGCFVFGIYFIPTILRAIRKYLTDEMLLIVSIGLCFGLVYIANAMGFSSALGAFMMGAILAETVEAEHIEGLVKPVKDLFGAIFFVSVGMLIDLEVLWEYKWYVAILTAVVMVGQLLFGTCGVLLSGRPLKTAIQSGFSLTQIGEFAFILASQGIALKVMQPYMYPIIVAVSVVTTFFTPYMIRLADPAYARLERGLPASWIRFLDRYASGSNTIRQQSEWRQFLRAVSRFVGVYLAVTLVLLFVWLQFRAAHWPPAPGAQRPTGIACGAAPAHGAAAAGHYDEEESLRGLPAALERQQIQPRPARFAHCAAHCPGAGLGAGAYGHAAAHQSAVGGRDHGERRARHPVFEGRPGTVDPHRATFRQQPLGA